MEDRARAGKSYIFFQYTGVFDMEDPGDLPMVSQQVKEILPLEQT